MARIPVSSRVIALALAGALSLGSKFEGERHVAYRDAVGVPTICRGHTAGVRMGQTATPALCERLAQEDTKAAINDVLSVVKVSLNENELAAYADFVYNLGVTKFRSSTMLAKLNAGDRVGACNEFPRWVFADKKVLRGLIARRAAERELCLLRPEAL